MRERPPHVSDADVLAGVREHWDDAADSVEHLPLGFGAHHWRVGDLFVTLDLLGRRHSRVSLEATYAAAAALAEQGLDFVLAGVPARGDTFTVPLGDDGSLSATPWRTGTAGDGSFSKERAATTAGFLDRLHATRPPPGLSVWHPLVGAGLADQLAARTAGPWTAGPHGETARTALRSRLAEIATWTADYQRLAVGTDPATWVPTHGEPDTGNQLATGDGVVLVDWESLMLAPAERDLRTLTDAGHPHPRATHGLLALFDLEWRLDEVAQYATWFEGPHGDTENDRIALGGLQHELEREARHSTDTWLRD